MQNRFKLFRGCLVASVFAFLSFAVSAQTSNVQPRITAAVNESQLTTLRGNTHPLARPQFDRGAAPDSLPMARMLLVLQRSAAQEAALDALMEQQQDKSSPNYHAWLTPEQFGLQFGPADADIQTITSWLESQGFTVNRVSNGRTVIEFSGTAGQVRDAFHTEIHRYNVNNEDHWANSSDPQIPTALTPVVAGIDTLYNFPREAMHHVGSAVTRSKDTGKLQSSQPPLFTLGGECGVPGLGCYGVTPYDFAIIYDVLPLWNATPTATDGTGETIAIVAESDINVQDVRDFRSYFGLPAKDPQFIYDGPDPGTVPGDETESDLDVEWSGGVAKGATIDFVISGSTETSLGVDLSAEYIVDNNLAPILSESYGICELGLGTTGNQFYDQLWQQAAAQGITVLVSSGDSGSAGCDPHGAPPPSPAQFGLMVSGFESTPYNVSVGGTDFNDLTNPALFWSTTNSPPPSNPSLPPSLSALSYIPETTWNASCTNGVLGTLGYSTNPETNCNNSQFEGLLWTLGGSGGKSACTTSDGQTPSSCGGGYAKPTWQAGTGVPADAKRDVPDVSLFSSINGPSGAFYLICAADLVPGSTSCQTTDSDTAFIPVGGTSASAPAFAGIMALVDQETGSRQGNANYVLYPLASKSGNRCTSAANPASTCVFYDMTNGTIAMPCATGSPNCKTSTPGDAYGVLSGYNTTTGYDLATGLGSVNAKNLVGAWATAETTLKTSSTTLTLNSGNAVNITHGHSVPVGIGVTGTPGTPSGNVSLIANTGPDGTEGVQGFTLSSGSASGSTNALPGGTYSVFAQYPGDGIFASSNSTTQSVTVAPEASKVSIAYELFDPSSGAITNSNATTAVFGTPSLLRVNVTSQAGDACANNAAGSSGCPTGSVAVTDNGSALDGGTFALNSLGYTEDQAIDLPGGTHNLAAKYNGDSSFNAPSPNPTTESLTLTPTPTQTIFVFSGNGVVGQSFTLQASIPSEDPIYSNIGPTGTVTFLIGTTTVGTATVSGSVNQTTHSISVYATTTTTSLPQGQDMITAKYSGDASYAASSTSSPTLVTVLYPATTTVSSSNPTVVYGTPVTYTAQVTTNQGGRPAITGNVSFSTDYGLGLGTVTLSNGSAQVTSSAVAGGVHNVIAYYSGDANYESVSGSVTETVTRVGTTTAVASSSSTIASGQSVTLTATISGGLSGLAQPSGTLQFSSNGISVGYPANVANGQAQLITTALPVGTDQITATYNGDTNYVGSSSSAITETVTPPPTFTITANPTAIPVSAPGAMGSTVLTFTAQNGFSSNGAVTVTPTCSGLPSETSCSSGTSITIPTNGTAMATVTFLTTAPSALIPASRNRPDIGGWRLTAGSLALACLLCAAMMAFGYREKRRGWGVALMFTVFALLAVSVGCGGGGSGNSGPPPNPGTPVGHYNGVSVSVTINGVTQTISGLTIDVQ